MWWNKKCKLLSYVTAGHEKISSVVLEAATQLASPKHALCPFRGCRNVLYPSPGHNHTEWNFLQSHGMEHFTIIRNAIFTIGAQNWGYTEKTIFPFLFAVNEIWSWWQFLNPMEIPFSSKTVTTIISHSLWKEIEI